MHDIYVMDRFTGEIIPSAIAIKAFYKTRGILDDWTVQYAETDMECNTMIDFPDFAKCLAKSPADES